MPQNRPRTRPYMFVFERVQAIGPEMSSWTANPRKRPGDSSDPGPCKKSIPGPSVSQPFGEDIPVD